MEAFGFDAVIQADGDGSLSRSGIWISRWIGCYRILQSTL